MITNNSVKWGDEVKRFSFKIIFSIASLRVIIKDGTAKSQFFVVRAFSLHKIYCRQDACATIGSHPIASSILFYRIIIY